MSKNRVSASDRVNNITENGRTYPKSPNSTNFDQTKRVNQQSSEGFPTHHHYRNTLNVPDPNNDLSILPMATKPAPLNPPRPAIMTTPKSSSVSVKNPSTLVNLSPTENRPLLLVTTDNDQQQPQTVVAPNEHHLPFNTHRQITHRTIMEIIPPRRFIHSRPRTALLFASTRMKENQQNIFLLV